MRAWRWILSRLFARVPNAPTDVRAVGTPGAVEVSWTPGPRAGRHNLEEEEHAVCVRFVDGACGEALRGCGAVSYTHLTLPTKA